ncbi:hypothetical protein T484DRAFT_1620022 [Baffinella frigidus]|nr:hypothetical protein T484DRAFT_1620022 [Cryptophyta sp. CCMP2293]
MRANPLNTQHPTPNTQHPTPNTQHPTPNTQPRDAAQPGQSVHPQPCTLNPKLKPLNPNPQPRGAAQPGQSYAEPKITGKIW